MPVVVGFSPWCVSLDAGVAADWMPDVLPAASRAFAIAAPPVGNVRGVSLSVATDAIYNNRYIVWVDACAALPPTTAPMPSRPVASSRAGCHFLLIRFHGSEI